MTAAALPVIVNRTGGTAGALGQRLEPALREAFARAGQAIDLILCEGDGCAQAVAGIAAPVVAVGGGDGTLAGAAGALAGTDTALAILPLGTRNHLARQLAIPLDLAQAAKVTAHGRAARIDLGRCGERVFVNNASIGLYTRLVRERDRHAGPKWLGTIPAAWHVLRHPRARPLRLVIDGAPRELITPLLFIGNNRYSLESGRVGERDSLGDGQLSLYAVEPKRPLALLAFALRTLVGRADPERDFAELACARTVTVEGSGPIEVAFDGEVMTLPLPLRFEIAPQALRVIVPDPAHRAE